VCCEITATCTGYFKLPAHQMLEHVAGHMKWLWEYEVLIAHTGGEVVENKNQQMCKQASNNTNHHHSTTSLPDSLYYQVHRYLMVQTYHFPHTMYREPSNACNSKAKCTCSRCKKKGHYRSNRRECLEHPRFKGRQVVQGSWILMDTDSDNDL
jgi:hypothetical protein